MSEVLTKQQEFVNLVRKEYGEDRDFVTRQEMLTLREKYNIPRQAWIKEPEFHMGRGKYKLPTVTATQEVEVDDIFGEDEDLDTQVILKPPTGEKIVTMEKKVVKSDTGLVPKPNPNFVPFGAYDDVYDILKSRLFFPVFLTGPTRSGKTEIPIQAAAVLKRNLYRVNITIETDETDLIGGMRLVNGSTEWEDGPVVKAMEDPDGGVLLLDEIDLGSNKIMCLQPVYEGNGIYIKKMNRWVYPEEGFTIIATANTKGRGSEDGRYIGTNVMNDALLERLTGATFEQGYPDRKVEIKILNNHLKSFGISDSNFAEPLAQWAENIRKTYADGGVDEVITTGRLLHIVKAYTIFGRNRLKAIKMALARFDVNTQTSFLDMYTKIDANAKDSSDTAPALPHHSTTSGRTLRPW